MTTLYAYGCSYTVGHELGTGLSFDDMTAWLIANTGCSSVDVANQLFGKNYHARVARPWYQAIHNKESPELSYAGVIANRLDYSYVNKAKRGVGIDYCFDAIVKDHTDGLIDWDNDIVMLGVPPFNRWQSLNSTPMAWNKARHIPNFDRSFFRKEGLIAWNQSMLITLKQLFPNLILLDLGLNPAAEDFFLTKHIPYSNKITISKLADDDMFGLWPGRHPTEHIHEQFAEYIIGNVL